MPDAESEAARLGIPPAEVDAYQAQRLEAARRGIPFLFTLPEWWACWQRDGRWERRGTGRAALVMARHGGRAWHPCSRAVITPKGRYASAALAAAAHGLTRQGAAARASRGAKGWRYE